MLRHDAGTYQGDGKSVPGNGTPAGYAEGDHDRIFLWQIGLPGFRIEDYRRADQPDGEKEVPVKTLDLYITDMTAEEREIVKAGCLINYNRGRH